jgi:thiol-disulfide isomerase/thioredoxin
MKQNVLLIILFVAQSVFAGITQGKVEYQITNNVITIVPQKGFHLNDKAPASAIYDNLKAIFRPKIITEQKMTFEVLPNIKKAQLKFFVCDDAKTVCEQHEKEVLLPVTTSGSVKPTVAPPAPQTRTESAPVNKYVDTKKPTLLIFSAPWCPACIRMESETYTKKSVQKVFSKLNVQKINIDLIENEKISNQFSVKAIPTLIMLDTNGEEMFRWLDYQPEQQFAKELANVAKAKESVVKLKALADAGDLVAAEKLARTYAGQMQWKNAANYMSLLKGAENLNLKLSYEMNYLSEAKDEATDKNKEPKNEYIKGLQKAISLSTSQMDQLRWKIELLESQELPAAELDKEFVLKIISDLNEVLNYKNKKRAALFAQSTMGDVAGFEIAETLDLRARAEQLLSLGAEKKQTQKKLAEQILSQKHDMKYPGQVINSIYYLNQAEKPEAAENLLKKLVEAYPKTYVYHQRYAGFLTKQKRNDEALQKIDEALLYKEGNEPQLNIIKIKILSTLNKKPEALALTEKTLKLVEVAPEKYKRTKTALLEWQDKLLKK